jgi:hypothetical protein
MSSRLLLVKRESAIAYRRILRDMKRLRLKVDDLPLDAQESMLAMHQNALDVMWEDRDNIRRRSGDGVE